MGQRGRRAQPGDAVSDRNDWPRSTTAPSAPEDPWAHRSNKMRCSGCMWFVVKESPNRTDGPNGSLGRCRRHAPTLNGFPAVFALDWCGDHKLDEGRV